MQIKDMVNFLEKWAPPTLQESYDNAGLIVGDPGDSVQKVLLTLDVTDDVLNEAIDESCQLIIAHHPLIFKGIKRIGKKHWLEKCIRKAIKHDIAIYAIHTNLDHVSSGVNKRICTRLGLENTSVLSPKNDTLSKLTFYVPTEDKETVLDAVFSAGAGAIGNYDRCSFQSEGSGTFRPNDMANPSIGTHGADEHVAETKVEVMIPQHLETNVMRALKKSHPYEEVAYYLSGLRNENQEVGAGMVGTLPSPISTDVFIAHLKKTMELSHFKATKWVTKEISRVAVCGGSGSFLLSKAIRSGADVFITSDFKYHEFFEANGQITILDIGHYESEKYTKNLLFDVLSETFSTFAFVLSKVDTNPVKYL